MNTSLLKAVASWAISAWICYVFLFSLPYKFTNHPDTAHIFGTIGRWMQTSISDAIGLAFIAYGAIAVGSVELTASLILLLPAPIWLIGKLARRNWRVRARMHCIGGALAAAVMCGAVFFHLATPLGIEVLHQGQSDGGSLFYAAVSILALGVLMAWMNFDALRRR